MPEPSILDRIRQDAERALLTNAIFRWESAVIIAGTVILSVFFNQWLPGWPVWAWPLGGLIAEIAIVVSSLTDKGEMEKVMEALFREKYNTAGIRDRDLRAKIEEAEQYRRRIQEVVAQQKSGVLRDRLVATTSQVYDWIANMVTLARRIDAYRADTIIRRDQGAVPKEIGELEKRLANERNPQVRAQIAETLESKRQFYANLQELNARMERADLQLEHSLAALGTVYSQLLLVSSKEVDSDRADRLREDIRGEVLALQDLVESLNEIYRSDTDAAERPAGATLRQRQAAR
jgi:5-bromo-4-chloroindolyl phosphate hydrolysis protein